MTGYTGAGETLETFVHAKNNKGKEKEFKIFYPQKDENGNSLKPPYTRKMVCVDDEDSNSYTWKNEADSIVCDEDGSEYTLDYFYVKKDNIGLEILRWKLVNISEWNSTDVKKFLFTASENIEDEISLSLNFMTNRKMTNDDYQDGGDAIASVGLSLYGQNDSQIRISTSTVSNNVTELNLYTGDSETFSAAFDDNNTLINDQISWSFDGENYDQYVSTDINLDDQDKNPAYSVKVTANSKPTGDNNFVILRATSKSNPAISKTVKINILQSSKENVKVTADATYPTVNVGKTLKLNVENTPKDSDEIIRWTSSADAVATVDENGVVTGITRGTAKITASSYKITNPSKITYSGYITVTVVDIGEISVKANDIQQVQWDYICRG